MTPASSVVTVSSLSLAYRLAHNGSSTFKETLIQLTKRNLRYERLWALSDVSFDVRRGEVFAIIGHNGAGKSTLMKVIARVLPPTEGRVVVHGSVAPMIELGAGFNGELTALENIVLYGTLLGRPPAMMRERATKIAEWAGLEGFLDVPVRSYSTGMLARLGFAVATDQIPDLLVVDEVLSVGDQAFQQKSQERIASLMRGGSAVVLVSHDLGTVSTLADRAMWLDHGAVKAIGPATEVVAAYQASV